MASWTTRIQFCLCAFFFGRCFRTTQRRRRGEHSPTQKERGNFSRVSLWAVVPSPPPLGSCISPSPSGGAVFAPLPCWVVLLPSLLLWGSGAFSPAPFGLMPFFFLGTSTGSTTTQRGRIPSSTFQNGREHHHIKGGKQHHPKAEGTGRGYHHFSTPSPLCIFTPSLPTPNPPMKHPNHPTQPPNHPTRERE